MSLREGAPLPVLLCILTSVTGVVDAVSFLALGHVFVANMTGNVVFLGFAAAGASDLSVPASLAAIVAFMAGAIAGGMLSARTPDRVRLLGIGVAVKIALALAALGVSLAHATGDGPARYTLIALLAVAMGLQSAVVRSAAGSEPSTNVLTTTLTALAADAPIGGGNGRSSHRALAALTMLAGAAAGAALVLKAGVPWALALATVLLAASGAVVYRLHGSPAR
jgi:uncharacterized membrane protein YoaK (UPF0700 family)